jgi:L-alanine-DL-glutamate epimerase-like enolase superfamily enzyme
MKVAAVDIEHVVLPLAGPIGFALGEIKSLGCLLLTVRADDGAVGENLVFSLNDRYSRVFAEMIRTLVPLVVGTDPAETPAFWEGAFRAINFVGLSGVSIVGISAIDGALWDLNARAAGLPLHRMLGGAAYRLSAYHSGGLWLSSSPAELAEEAIAMTAAGWLAVKVRIGAATAKADVERVRAVRSAIGPTVKLMADANQALSESEAIRRGRLLEEFDLVWFEEPLPLWDIDGLARVRSKVPMPIASGESHYTRHEFRRLIEARAADVLMPDLQRVGGVSEFMRVAEMAAAAGLAVSSHLFSEASVQLLAALPNARSVEYMPWFERLYHERLEFDRGDLLVPDRPGWGFTFDRDYVAHLAARS